jgi:hypothetical protein
MPLASSQAVQTDPFAAMDGTRLRDLLTSLVEKFESAEDASYDARLKAERDVDYYDGKQWTEAEAKVLKDRKQPVVAKNMVRPKIDYLQGLERSQRTEPRALPVTPQHEDDAHAATDALRSVTQANRYDQVRSAVWLDMLRTGWGGVEVAAEESKKGVPTIKVFRCQWDRMFWDPYSAAADFSDANYLGLVVWMDREAAVRKWGEAAGKVFDETLSHASLVTTFDDKPKNLTWVDRSKRRRIRIVQMYHRDDASGQWQFCEFTKGGFLRYGPSPWLDDDGDPEHPYSWRSTNIDRDNNRYGAVRDLIDTQDGINKRESKMLHMVSVRQTFGTETSLSKNMTTQQLRQELAKPDGHVSLREGVEWGKQFGVIETGDMVTAQFQLLAEAKADMQQRGPNASMQGKGAAGASGRAILANQQGGQIEATPQTDMLREMDHEAYRKIWRRVRQFWDAETWVRVTDDEKGVRFVQLNAPMLDPMTGQPVLDEMGQPVAERPVAELEVDIEIDDAPAIGTMLQEQFELLVQLKQMDQPTPAHPNGEIPFKSIIKAAPNLRAKQQMLSDIDAEEQRAQQPNPAKQMAEQLQMAGAQAEVQKTAATVEKTAAEAERTKAQTAQIVQEIQMKPAEMQMEAQQQAQATAMKAEQARQRFQGPPQGRAA